MGGKGGPYRLDAGHDVTQVRIRLLFVLGHGEQWLFKKRLSHGPLPRLRKIRVLYDKNARKVQSL